MSNLVKAKSCKHTPGPWGYAAESWYRNRTPVIYETGAENESKGLVLAHVAHNGEGNCGGQLGDPIADARLMAAAPELLEACQALVLACLRRGPYEELLGVLAQADRAILSAGSDGLEKIRREA